MWLPFRISAVTLIIIFGLVYLISLLQPRSFVVPVYFIFQPDARVTPAPQLTTTHAVDRSAQGWTAGVAGSG